MNPMNRVGIMARVKYLHTGHTDTAKLQEKQTMTVVDEQQQSKSMHTCPHWYCNSKCIS